MKISRVYIYIYNVGGCVCVHMYVCIYVCMDVLVQLDLHSQVVPESIQLGLPSGKFGKIAKIQKISSYLSRCAEFISDGIISI